MKRAGQLAIILASLMLVTIKCSGGVNPGQARDTHQAIALTAAIRPDACILVATGSPGRNSFTLHLLRDPCRIPVRGKALCYAALTPTRSWTTGPAIRRPGTSKAQCSDSVRTNPVGFVYGTARTWVFIGPIPSGTTVGPPSSACNPRASVPEPLTNDVKATFARDPCRLQLRASAACLNGQGGPGSTSWEAGPVIRRAGSSTIHCPILSTTWISPFGWAWRPRTGGRWSIVQAGPMP